MATTQKISIELDDGETKTVTADGRDVRFYEATTGLSALTGGVSMTMLTMMAYSAGKRAGYWSDSWEDFEARCVWTNPDTERTAAGPTRPARGAGSSSRSQSEPGSASSSGKKRAPKRS